MLALFLQGDLPALPWTQFGVAGGVIFIVFIFLVFVLKIVPGITATWKEIKIAEIGVREEETKTRSKEAESRSEQAHGFSQLAGALSQMSNVLHDVVIEQRHATEKVMILQRVNADTSEQAMGLMNDLMEEITSVKESLAERKNDGTKAKQTPTD